MARELVIGAHKWTIGTVWTVGAHGGHVHIVHTHWGHVHIGVHTIGTTRTKSTRWATEPTIGPTKPTIRAHELGIGTVELGEEARAHGVIVHVAHIGGHVLTHIGTHIWPHWPIAHIIWPVHIHILVIKVLWGLVGVELMLGLLIGVVGMELWWRWRWGWDEVCWWRWGWWWNH